MRQLLPLALALVLLAAPSLTAQAQTGGVRVGTAGTPDPSAVLDLRPDAATAPKGFLPPRLSQAQRDAIAGPAPGLTVFNTSTNALNVWDGTQWVAYLADNTPPAGTPPPAVFGFTGVAQTYTVPAGVTRLGVDLAGAAGGPIYGNSAGQGLGGRVQAVLAVAPGQVLTLYVGGAGARSAGGYNGGGGASQGDGGGGGATDLRLGGTALGNRVLVAGGGGGGGDSGAGGCGGGLTGCAGAIDPFGTGGGGGGQTAPGAGGAGGSTGGAGSAAAGSLGGTGNGYSGGGGGGYFGGGSGGGEAGGGGGSSFAGAGTSAVLHTQGYRTGAGYVRLYPNGNGVVSAPTLDASNFINLPPGDNLGNHTATQNLNLGTNQLVGNGSVNVGNNLNLGANQLVGNGSVNVGNNLNLGTNQLVGNGGSQGLSVSSAGRVGIGTAAPAAPLDVQAGAALTSSTTGTETQLRLTRPGTSNAKWNSAAELAVGTYATGINAQSQLDFRLGNGGSNAADQTVLSLRGDGRVGLGTAAPRGQLDVAGGGDSYLVDNPDSGSGQSLYLPGHVFLAPYSGTSGTAYVQARVPNPTSSTNIGLTLRTTNAGALTNAVTISSDGDVNVLGQVGAGYTYVFSDSNVSGNTTSSRFATCPAGTSLLSGGGGHRDFNSAAQDIKVNYSGPDPSDPEHTWRIIIHNDSGNDRAIRVYCNCARIR